MTILKVKSREKKNLGQLEIPNQARVLMLPSDAKGVVVSYAPGITITCNFPAAKKKVIISNYARNKRNINVEIPATLMSMELADIPRIHYTPVNQFKIFGYYQRDKTTIWAAPFILSNVYSEGRICFGSLHPKDLRSAYNLFWNAPFNDELLHVSNSIAQQMNSKVYNSASSTIKNYQEQVFDKQDWRDHTFNICGRSYWASERAQHGLLITDNKHLVKQIPKKYWLRRGANPFIIASAKRFKNVWGFDTGHFKFKVPVEQIATR